jgi:CHASE2 domain-containing sensor protein
MQHPIRDDAAITFARRFYRTLFQGENSGRVEVAMSEARNRLAGDFPGKREVATPVLFMRTRGEVLFDPSSQSARSIFKLVNWREFRRTKEIIRDYEINSQAEDSSIQEQEYARRNARQALDLSKRLKLAHALALTTSGVVAVVFLVSWVGLFNLPQLVGYSALGRVTDMITMMLGDRVRPQIDPASANSLKTSIVQVRIEEPIDKSWRKRHGEIIEKLSEAGASVVGFDIYFEDDGQDDAFFSESIRRARARNTAVVLGARSVADGEPLVSTPLKQAATAIGILCLGTKWGYAAIAPVVLQKASQPDKLVPSLSLAMHMADRGANGISLERAGRIVQIWGGDLPPYEFGVSEVTKVNKRQVNDDSERACPAIEHDDIVADRYIAFSPLRPRHDYLSKILSSYEKIEASTSEELKENFEGRMVLIGVADPGDQLTSHTDLINVRYGMEVHVDAIRSLAQPHAIRALSWQQQFLTSVVLGSLAAAIVFGVPAERRLTRRGLFWAVALGYIGCAIAIYLKYNILLNTVYQFGAFAIVYWAALRIERQYAI